MQKKYGRRDKINRERWEMMVEKTEEYKRKGKMVKKEDTMQVRKKNKIRSSSFYPPQPILYYVPTHSPPHLLFLPLPFSPLSPISPVSLLVLTPSLVRLLIRGGGTIVPLLPLFGNPGLKQTLFTQVLAQPGPCPSLQLGQV